MSKLEEVTSKPVSKHVRLFLNNLPWEATESTLKSEFKKKLSIDEILELTVERRENGQSKGFGFVTFSSPELAQKATELFNGYDLSGRSLIIEPARTRRTVDKKKPFHNSKELKEPSHKRRKLNDGRAIDDNNNTHNNNNNNNNKGSNQPKIVDVPLTLHNLKSCIHLMTNQISDDSKTNSHTEDKKEKKNTNNNNNNNIWTKLPAKHIRTCSKYITGLHNNLEQYFLSLTVSQQENTSTMNSEFDFYEELFECIDNLITVVETIFQAGIKFWDDIPVGNESLPFILRKSINKILQLEIIPSTINKNDNIKDSSTPHPILREKTITEILNRYDQYQKRFEQCLIQYGIQYEQAIAQDLSKNEEKTSNDHSSLYMQILTKYKEFQLDDSTKKQYKEEFDNIINILQKIQKTEHDKTPPKQLTIKVFGGFSTPLGMKKSSDLDLGVYFVEENDTEKMKKTIIDEHNQLKNIYDVISVHHEKYYEKALGVLRVVQQQLYDNKISNKASFSRRIPLLQLKQRTLPVDISLYQPSNLLRAYQIHKICQSNPDIYLPFFFFLREWAHIRRLTNAPNELGAIGMTVYGFICLGICAIHSFNQTKNIKLLVPKSLQDIPEDFCGDRMYFELPPKQQVQIRQEPLSEEDIRSSNSHLINLFLHFCQLILNFDPESNVFAPNNPLVFVDSKESYERRNRDTQELFKEKWEGWGIIDPDRDQKGEKRSVFVRIEDPVDCLDNPARQITWNSWHKIKQEVLRLKLMLEQYHDKSGTETNKNTTDTFFEKTSKNILSLLLQCPQTKEFSAVSKLFYS